MSELLVSTVEHVILEIGITEFFLGIILIPLIGNVAEYVLGSVPGRDALEERSADAVAEYLGSEAAQVFVIGGSALSPPAIAVDHPHPVDLSDAAHGYSDVGFRLAFTSPTETTAEQIMNLAQQQPYLPPQPGQ